jgi:hypothetical protein
MHSCFDRHYTRKGRRNETGPESSGWRPTADGVWDIGAPWTTLTQGISRPSRALARPRRVAFLAHGRDPTTSSQVSVRSALRARARNGPLGGNVDLTAAG